MDPGTKENNTKISYQQIGTYSVKNLCQIISYSQIIFCVVS